MERLTYVTENGEILFHPEDLPEDEGMTVKELAENRRWKTLDQIAEKLTNMEQMEEQGLLVRLPCKVGDSLYCIVNGEVKKLKVHSFGASAFGITDIEFKYVDGFKILRFIGELGKTVFFAREEAEKKLEELKNEI